VTKAPTETPKIWALFGTCLVLYDQSPELFGWWRQEPTKRQILSVFEAWAGLGVGLGVGTGGAERSRVAASILTSAGKPNRIFDYAWVLRELPEGPFSLWPTEP
jgi:hypothetical protein